jgi:hypothetical protein
LSLLTEEYESISFFSRQSYPRLAYHPKVVAEVAVVVEAAAAVEVEIIVKEISRVKSAK